ncbi:SAM-dependent methyltransferase [Alteromonas halophila]|uniref:Tetrapyrrole methylase domain-containing protein n=1 Tax=Alteromonas halophila TaxID=516698 RepID=A0A918JCX4_9ALTE|nr:SAM-dependent methyltransferase [Alteromonas halophila]GGW74780.1 hypothetical protein GCM10007391_03550 [Alteromonas halophila]
MSHQSHTNKSGSIVCVGVGMTLGAHITPIARSYIEQADVVFCNVSNRYVEEWIMSMNDAVTSLQCFYEEGKNRSQTYRQMVDTMLAAVRDGKQVVGAFYGHPGVFAWAPHKVIEEARQQGYRADMLPGISAEDCLFADMGIDPGKMGCQHLEASQLMLFERTLDTAGYLIVWQVGVAGDVSREKFVTTAEYRELLVEVLCNDYPPQHNVALYEARVLPVDSYRIEWLRLENLANATIHQHTTLVIPPSRKPAPNQSMRARLDALTQQERR